MGKHYSEANKTSQSKSLSVKKVSASYSPSGPKGLVMASRTSQSKPLSVRRATETPMGSKPSQFRQPASTD